MPPPPRTRQSAFTIRICSIVLHRVSSSFELATRTASDCGREIATFRRLRENRNSRLRGRSAAARRRHRAEDDRYLLACWLRFNEAQAVGDPWMTATGPPTLAAEQQVAASMPHYPKGYIETLVFVPIRMRRPGTSCAPQRCARTRRMRVAQSGCCFCSRSPFGSACSSKATFSCCHDPRMPLGHSRR